MDSSRPKLILRLTRVRRNDEVNMLDLNTENILFNFRTTVFRDIHHRCLKHHYRQR